ncbi:hypothetical protein PILCRDRAFT_111333 [Piloderma croceum F 1598]|uniref:Uncharacterized protein n=1 Tax=Piloderma croceum (strain F 1598) TaxID=765440 RepID=A0A0C3GKF2_PILCF|nr:hypothetical protein PILCRDRAFT_111333 [Piloderma croceum F 1598]
MCTGSIPCIGHPKLDSLQSVPLHPKKSLELAVGEHDHRMFVVPGSGQNTKSRRIPNLPSGLCKCASVLRTVTFCLLVASSSSLEMTAFRARWKLGRALLFLQEKFAFAFVLSLVADDFHHHSLVSHHPGITSSSRPSCHITRRNTPSFSPAQWPYCLLVRIQISIFSYCASLPYFLSLRNSRG